MARDLARRIRAPGGILDGDDVVSVAVVALVSAADDWDPSRGASFATYASIRVRGAVISAVSRPANNDSVPTCRGLTSGDHPSAPATAYAGLGEDIRTVFALLPKRHARVLRRHFIEGLPAGECLPGRSAASSRELIAEALSFARGAIFARKWPKIHKIR